MKFSIFVKALENRKLFEIFLPANYCIKMKRFEEASSFRKFSHVFHHFSMFYRR